MGGLPRTVLHVGCGRVALPRDRFPEAEWREIRLDIDPGVRPDVVASLTDMVAVPSGSVDAVYSSHNLEHLYAHEVPVALAEFLRVLRPGGVAVVEVPDLRKVAEMVAADRLEDTAYVSPRGPITPLDMIFGFRPELAAGNAFMAHHTGFTASSLGQSLQRAGFARGECFPGDWETRWEAVKAEE